MSFSDIYGHWAQTEINAACNNGWINGCDDGTFKSDQYIIRAEAITLINRALQRVPENKNDLPDNMVMCPDNTDTTKWYFLAIQEAANSHDYVRKSNGCEYWTKLSGAHDWTEPEKQNIELRVPHSKTAGDFCCARQDLDPDYVNQPACPHLGVPGLNDILRRPLADVGCDN